jgi:putative restriction endonuclease
MAENNQEPKSKRVKGLRKIRNKSTKTTLAMLDSYRKKHTSSRGGRQIEKPSVRSYNNYEDYKDRNDQSIVASNNADASVVKLHGQDLLDLYERILGQGGTEIKAAIECGWDYKTEMGWLKQEIRNLRTTREDHHSFEFYCWLTEKNLSSSTQNKYFNALKGQISVWCKKHGILSTDLLAIRELGEFKNARLFLEKDRSYIESNKKGKDMYKRALDYYERFLEEERQYSTSETKGISISKTSVSASTEKDSSIKIRLGHTTYRSALEDYWDYCCSVTSTPDSRHGSILIASHIKPWSKSTDAERLDVFNGLLLTPNLDKLFDIGYISFAEDGLILVSSELQGTEELQLHKQLSIRKEKLSIRHLKYLEYHRSNILI